MYLLAIKSFYRFLPGGEIIIIDDGTLKTRHRAAFVKHLGAPRFLRVDEVVTDPCPKGGTWERLLQILELRQDNYVIQLDSDMLAIEPLPEVVAAIAANRAFTLNTGSEFRIDSVEAAAAIVEADGSAHIQTLAERMLPRLPPGMGRLYVRGSSGFAGFARGHSGRKDAVAFSAAMQDILGLRWNDWGSEQVTSNYLVANSPGSIALPWPKYACNFHGVDPDEVSMMHFVGTWRWRGGIYMRMARRVIRELNQVGGERPRGAPEATF
ncbi:MAG TPA: hypothetical protein VEY31_04670 [Roseococcus sp.]|nr:hypothetical protein [Roseococcus sp.]